MRNFSSGICSALSCNVNIVIVLELQFFPKDFLCVVQVSDDIRNAIVYLDAGCTESFQFLGAFPLLLEIGARAVCSLENTSPLDQVRLILIWDMGLSWCLVF